jgi:hypothetical protein
LIIDGRWLLDLIEDIERYTITLMVNQSIFQEKSGFNQKVEKGSTSLGQKANQKSSHRQMKQGKK